MLLHELLIRQHLEEGYERLFILAAEPHAGGWMLGEIGIEGGATAKVVIVMLDDFFERLKAPVVHVRCRESDIAQAGRGEFVEVAFVLGHPFAAGIRLDG